MVRSTAVGKEVRPKEVDEVERQDIVCFSHLRWNHVFQRPQHLMSRFARHYRVFIYEEARLMDDDTVGVEVNQYEPGIYVVTPQVPLELSPEEGPAIRKKLLDSIFAEYDIQRPVLWYYSPMFLDYTRHLQASLVVYDCMDDLASFKGANPVIPERESELMSKADLVFTGGQSLYDLKCERHPAVHLFPSSVDVEHFRQARDIQDDPADQADIPHPRLGYFGVIDERMDLGLLTAIADARPEWHFVCLGPIEKIKPDQVPMRPNIHFLGMKAYQELPAYLSGWDVALLPFAQNQATRHISPTKIPEYLAGGRPVVSTPIRDVVRPYGEQGLVWIADTVSQFVRAIEAALNLDASRPAWLARVDTVLERNSWDKTWSRMESLIRSALTADSEKKNNGQSPTRKGNGSREPDNSKLSLVDLPVAAGEQHRSTPVKRRGHDRFDFLVVGAGFAGSVLAERLARGSGKRVLVVDCRPHIGGNAFDHHDENGLLVHKYGPHIFHTNSKEVFTYLSQFTRWRPYEHRVLASVDGQLVPIPINLDTVNRLYGLQLNSFELDQFFQSVAEKVEEVRTSEDVVVSRVGRELYEKFFQKYTRKQWGLDPSELDSSVTSRVPVRLNRDDRYFSDTYQAMPLHGYTRMFENLLDHPNIKILLNTDYREIVDMIPHDQMIYTGPVDEFFDYCYGTLPYRSLEFKFETLNLEQHQPVAVVNYPNEHAYTRVTEFKHLTGQKHPKTSLVYEYPCSEGDPYYPIPRPENAELYKRYKKLADSTSGVHFAGRLATYRYYNMDQVTAQALTLYAKIAGMPRTEAVAGYSNSQFSIEVPCTLLIP